MEIFIKDILSRLFLLFNIYLAFVIFNAYKNKTNKFWLKVKIYLRRLKKLFSLSFNVEKKFGVFSRIWELFKKNFIDYLNSIQYYPNRLSLFIKTNPRLITNIYVLILSVIFLQLNTWMPFLNYLAIIGILAPVTIIIDYMIMKISSTDRFTKVFIIILILCVGYMYYFGFLFLDMTNRSFSLLTFFVSLYFLIISLILAIRVAPLMNSRNIISSMIIVLHAASIAFFSYMSIGYGFMYYEHDGDLNDISLNVNNSNGFNSFVIFAYHGLSSIASMPNLIESKAQITIEIIQFRLISIAFTTIYTGLILSYSSNVLFKKRTE